MARYLETRRHKHRGEQKQKRATRGLVGPRGTKLSEGGAVDREFKGPVSPWKRMDAKSRPRIWHLKVQPVLLLSVSLRGC
jgi:hypothetical protein